MRLQRQGSGSERMPNPWTEYGERPVLAGSGLQMRHALHASPESIMRGTEEAIS